MLNVDYLMSFCFIMKNDYFKQKLLLWSQVPFKAPIISVLEKSSSEGKATFGQKCAYGGLFSIKIKAAVLMKTESDIVFSDVFLTFSWNVLNTIYEYSSDLWRSFNSCSHYKVRIFYLKPFSFEGWFTVTCRIMILIWITVDFALENSKNQDKKLKKTFPFLSS